MLNENQGTSLLPLWLMITRQIVAIMCDRFEVRQTFNQCQVRGIRNWCQVRETCNWCQARENMLNQC